jgi:hypothetical protein
VAREITALSREPGDASAALDRAIARLTDGRTAGHEADKARRLAVAWAREQVRLALEEVIARAAAEGRARSDLPADTLAWILLAAADALIYEPADAAADRILALRALLAPTSAAGTPGSGRPVPPGPASPPRA